MRPFIRSISLGSAIHGRAHVLQTDAARAQLLRELRDVLDQRFNVLWATQVFADVRDKPNDYRFKDIYALFKEAEEGRSLGGLSVGDCPPQEQA